MCGLQHKKADIRALRGRLQGARPVLAARVPISFLLRLGKIIQVFHTNLCSLPGYGAPEKSIGPHRGGLRVPMAPDYVPDAEKGQTGPY